eukprot:3011539-Pleurochrysis_carterae.AAC.1
MEGATARPRQEDADIQLFLHGTFCAEQISAPAIRICRQRPIQRAKLYKNAVRPPCCFFSPCMHLPTRSSQHAVQQSHVPNQEEQASAFFGGTVLLQSV